MFRKKPVDFYWLYLNEFFSLFAPVLHCILTSCQEVNKYICFVITLYGAVNTLTDGIYVVRIVFTLNFFACLVRGFYVSATSEVRESVCVILMKIYYCLFFNWMVVLSVGISIKFCQIVEKYYVPRHRAWFSAAKFSCEILVTLSFFVCVWRPKS